MSEKRSYSPVAVAPAEVLATVEPDWSTLITAMPQAVRFEATTYHKGPWPSISRPVCVQCSDKVFRVIKRPIPPQVSGCLIFNDQVIARLAQHIGAPVPAPAIVHLSAELIVLEPKLAHLSPGLCHGSEFRDDHSDREGVANFSLPENRERFAKLALLYGWAHGSDLQQIYPKTPPFLVLSVDHGHFIAAGQPWTAATLADIPSATADPAIVAQAAITDEELRAAAILLECVTPDDIARAIAAPPDEWGVSAEDRASLCAYFWRRRTELLNLYPTPATMPTPEAAGKE